MDFKQVKYFLNLADTLNFTRAAELSQISQPALTKAIRRLEDELGGLLVFRDGKDTRLTELGRTIRGEFEKIISSVMQAEVLADQVVNEKRVILSIGIISTLGPMGIWDFLSHYLSEMSQVEVVVKSVDPKDMMDMVLSGSLDVCFCVNEMISHPKLISTHLYTECLKVAASTEHKFSKLVEVPPKLLAHEVYIDREHCEFRQQISDYFMDQMMLMRPKIRTVREDWVQYAVARDFGIAIVPEYTRLHDNIILRPVKGMNISRDISLVSIYGSATSSAVKRLREMAQNYDWPE